ncbi:MAG: sulfatase-like hydrolase/transferase [Candidatus Latescibacterota bacterium]|nr:sulfatase-like hydrolase/transferase [Candidatus Latescibacterota bacterium]
MKPGNFLFISSDQHNKGALGCYGHPVVKTPNLDRLAARGTRFENAYTNCPICVPVRASLATGRYVHQTRYWDNGHPYDGRIDSWHHRLREQGYHVDSIGKLHFSDSSNDHGFTNEIDPLHVVEGIGDILGCIRGDQAPTRKKRSGILDAGPGESTYLDYDVRNADNGCAWLNEHKDDKKPWAVFLSFVCPHPPYICPQKYFNQYINQDLEFGPQWKESDWPKHPAVDYMRKFFDFDPQFADAEIKQMIAAYLGACSHLDEQIGRVLDRLDTLGLTDSTRVIYTSDHGEHQGARGVYGKFSMFEESAGIPYIAAGPNVPAGKVCKTPVSLVDTFPTAVECVGAAFSEADSDLPGDSIWSIANAPDQDRTVFSEYHAVGSRHASYMLRDLTHKYVHYAHEPAQLFDMVYDSNELDDISRSDPARVAGFETRLLTICDPIEQDQHAKDDQATLIESHGGVEAVLNRGAFDNSPVPGEKPAFRKH